MPNQKRIALMMDSGNGYFREVTRGVCRFAREKTAGAWLIRMTRATPGALPQVIEWAPDGLIAAIQGPQLYDALLQLNRPVINVGGVLGSKVLDPSLRVGSGVLESKGLPDSKTHDSKAALADFPRVRVDDRAVGRMAAAHFLERGFHNFAFIGLRTAVFSGAREKGFAEALAEAGFSYTALYLGTTFEFQPDTWITRDENIEIFLRGLPRPCALLVASDSQCYYIAELCHHLGIHIPEELALLGVDNDELFCELSSPRLSSVRPPSQEIGYAAAQLLSQLMDGLGSRVSGFGLANWRPETSDSKQPVLKHEILFAPVGVVTRQSTDVVAIEDADLAAAVRYIRKNAGRPISVEDVLREVPVSRRALELKFRDVLNRSPLQEISRVHVDRACELLALTDLPMPSIATQSGFSNAERLSVVFKRKTGMTPTEYREKHRVSR